MSDFPVDTPEHLACMALGLTSGNTMVTIERLEGAAWVLKHWKRMDVLNDERPGGDRQRRP